MPEPYDWAVHFETEAKEMMLAGEYKPLVDYEQLGPEALLSIPTPDHYLPLLYVIGAIRQPDRITFPVEGIDGRSVSMLAVQVGQRHRERGTGLCLRPGMSRSRLSISSEVHGFAFA